jgi:hypothetical protein
MSVLLTSGLTAPKTAVDIREDIARRWADASRHLRADEADDLWRQLMQEWLTPLIVNQEYWNGLLTRRMAAFERKERRATVSDDQWDDTHQDMNR